MRLLFDFFPILIFFIVFKFYGIWIATSAFLIASCLQILFFWLRYRRVEKMHLITFVIGLVLGAATLLLHNELFIKWKPTVIYWAMGIAFLGTQFFGDKPLLQRMMDGNLSLPKAAWQKLNISWVIFFIVMGLLNIYVAYHFDTNTWVNFKLFGMLGLTLVFVIAQAIYMGRHLKTHNEQQ